MVWAMAPDRLEGWLARAGSGLLASFARGVGQDRAAVQAVIMLPLTVAPAPSASHPRATAYLTEEQLPGRAPAQHEQDPRQRREIGHSRPTTLRLGPFSRKQRCDLGPEPVGKSGLPISSPTPNPVLPVALSSESHSAGWRYHYWSGRYVNSCILKDTAFASMTGRGM